MKLVKIPVSVFVKKIILAENDYAEPVVYNRKNESLFLYLSFSQAQCRLKSTTLKELLGEVICVQMQDWHAAQVNRNPYLTGWVLHKLYRQKLNEFLAACVDSGKGVQDSIFNFCIEKDIDIDEDISLDALTRSWRRYNALRKGVKSEKKQMQYVRYNFTKKRTRSDNTSTTPTLLVLPRTDSELEQICTQYEAAHPAAFLRQDGKPYKFRRSQLRCWVYRTVGNRKAAAIAEKFKMNEMTVFKQVYSFTDLLRTLPPVAF